MISITVANLGSVAEPSVTVQALANGAVVATANVANLAAGGTKTLALTWNTAGFATGSYLISGFAVPVPGETILGNNRLDDGMVTLAPSAAQITVATAFGDGNFNPLPLDKNGNPKVDVVIAKGVVKSTNPGEVLALVDVANTGGVTLDSLMLTETLPVDWVAHPDFLPAVGSIQVFFVYANGTERDITDKSNLATTTGNPETVSLSIANIAMTAAGMNLEPRTQILIAVKMQYGLKGTSQPAHTYPRTYTDTTAAAAWTGTSFTGTEADGSSSGFFVAYAKVLGDTNRDFVVDIMDAATVAVAYGSKIGDKNFSPDADFDNSGVIDIMDMAVTAYYYGTSSW
jgi:hypothetical protein